MQTLTQIFLKSIKQRLENAPFPIQIPPPIFSLMEGEILAVDIEKIFISIRFPVKEIFQNPYGSMQGGMIATAIDNTIGPIALFHKELNVTKRLEIDYEKMITKGIEYIYVDASYVSEEGRDIYYEAIVHDQSDLIYARAKAHHKKLR